MSAEPISPALSPGFRVFSAFELLLGAAIVIGHNVYHVVPNEVLILFVLALISLRLRNGNWSAIGFKRPSSWLRILCIALAAAALRIALGYLIEKWAAHFWPPIQAPAGAEELSHNIKNALLGLALIWTFAAFGEEIVYRGYLTTRAADIGGGSSLAYWLAIIITSVLFGYGHYYKGPIGILDSSIAGLALGSAYLLSGRNLWACVLAHGFIDTTAVFMIFLGLDKS